MRRRQVPLRLLRGQVSRSSLFLAFALLAGAAAFHVACDDSSSAIKESTPDSGTTAGADAGGQPGVDGGADGGPSDCFQNPMTHFEIINACTNAVKITKNPTLPKLLPDGGLPPLQ
jgi:hypothetical protein